MKQEKDKTKKQRRSIGTKAIKPACGTLSYITACRGIQKKSDSVTAPPDSSDRMSRK